MDSEDTSIPPSDGPLTLATLGHVSLTYVSPTSGETAVLGPGKPLAVLTYLAFSPGRSASREHLIDLLWSDLEPERGKHALRQTIYFLRHHLGERALIGRQGELELALPLRTDRDAFLEAVEQGELERAVELYAGSFLPGFASPGGAEFEHWADLERERLRSVFVRTAETLARRHLASSSFRDAQRLARRIRDEDPLNESSWRLLIETLISANEMLAAAIEADALSTLLKSEGREPEPATRAILRLARQRPAPGSDAPANRGLMAELVGREREFASIIRAWDEARRGLARHIHVTAPAGFGKTRLLADVQGRLRASGARVIHLRANPGDRRISYVLAGELARAVGTLPGAAAISPAAASALIALHPGLSSHFAGSMDQSSGDDALRRRTMAMTEVLAAVADESPVALLMDDLHWADPASVQLFLGILDRTDGSRILVVTASRPMREGMLEVGATERLSLDPLSVPQVSALLASLGALPREDWVRSLTAALHAASDGSPLLVLETLQLALDRGSLTLDGNGWSCADPVFLITELQAGGALRHRTNQLDRNSRQLLLLLATAGAPLTLGRLSRAALRSVEQTEYELGTLERRGFVLRSGNEWEPAHDQIAEIAIESSSSEAIRAAHAALGRVLSSDSQVDHHLLPRAAHHLVASGDEQELEELYARWLQIGERRGDRRSPEALAAELLGDFGTAERIGGLTGGLPLWQRMRWRRKHWGIAAAAVLTVAAVAAAAQLRGPAAPEPELSLLALWPTVGDSVVVARLPFGSDRFASAEPLDLTSGTATAGMSDWSRLIGSPRGNPEAKSWVYARSTADSGGIDVFVRGADERERRLTDTPRDDLDPTWSPDGRLIAFATNRWSPRASDDSDIAILEVATGAVRRLTSGEMQDYATRWSADGTRIAFARRHVDFRPTELCWITPDATIEHCFVPSGFEVTALLGWENPRRLLTLADSVDRQFLLTVDVDTRAARAVDVGEISQAVASPDGQWIACLCRRAGDAAPAWYVFPTTDPERARRVYVGTEIDRGPMVYWDGARRAAGRLYSVGIVPPAGSISVDATYRLRVAGRNVIGQPVDVPTPTLRWYSADTTVAVVDSVTGILRPRRLGSVLVHVSAGGWRRDSTRVTIGVPDSKRRLVDEWAAPTPDSTRWVLFGQPAASIVAGPGGRRGFWNGGDGAFTSGAYSRPSFAAHRGLGLETTLSSPVTRPQRQLLQVALYAVLDSVVGGDRDVYAASSAGSIGRSLCGLNFPGGEGATARRRFVLSGGGVQTRVPAPPVAAQGGWYRVRLQIFPDGTCGVAVEGRPVWRSEASLPLERPYRVLLQGNSVGTKLLVGPVEVWEGVRGDVDWAGVEADSL